MYYDGFEEGSGNSTAQDSYTGHYSYLGTYSRAMNGLDNGSYLLTYWQKLGNLWSLVMNTVSVSTGSYAISLSGQIDDVRFYPASAQMTTSTFDPLTGITSSTNPKSNTTFYEYDTFQRLKTIKDHNGDIVKSFSYNYSIK